MEDTSQLDYVIAFVYNFFLASRLVYLYHCKVSYWIFTIQSVIFYTNYFADMKGPLFTYSYCMKCTSSCLHMENCMQIIDICDLPTDIMMACDSWMKTTITHKQHVHDRRSSAKQHSLNQEKSSGWSFIP